MCIQVDLSLDLDSFGTNAEPPLHFYFPVIQLIAHTCLMKHLGI